MNAPAAATTPAGFRIGPIEFAPGISGLNAWTYLYASFAIMPIVSFLSFSQPYVLSEIVGLPQSEHGRVTGYLVTMQEIVALALVGIAGGLSDRFGRRAIYAFGVLVAGIGFALYAQAQTELDLYVYRFVYAVGVSFAGIMIAVTAADYPAESSRGKLAGMSGVLNGLGVGLATALVAALPAAFKAQGMPNDIAGRYMLYVMAGLCFLTAMLMQLGLKGGTPTGERRRVGLLLTLRTGFGAAMQNSRLVICYGGSFVSRADLTLVATFVSLWLQQAGRNEGLDGAEAIAKAGIMFAVIQGSSLLWAPIAGILLDRLHRLACVVAALLIAGIGYTLLGLQEHPFAPLGYLSSVLVGIGQMSVILSVTALLGQEAPVAVRGSVIGLAGLWGAIGILSTSLIGGYLFDHWMISGPILLVGFANFLVFCGALAVWIKNGRPLKFDPSEIAPGTATVSFGGH